MLLIVFLLGALCSPTIAFPAQVALDTPLHTSKGVEDRRLHGRFLHITDMHPDPYYKPGSRPSTVCHRGKPKKHPAGHYGTAYEHVFYPTLAASLRYLRDSLRVGNVTRRLR
ncbi:hypothetical protein V8B97DRAFT_118144 [Scleroderma yunnanense]